MQDEQIKYIMNSQIGPLLCKGFAYLYRDKPEFPIRRLGQWLLAQGRRKIDHKQISSKDEKKSELAEKLRSMQQHREKLREAAQKVETWEEQKQRFLDEIKLAEYPEDLLEHWLPDYLEKEKGLSGCYVGLLDHQKKITTDNDQDENAHIDMEAPKAVAYIGASDSNKKLMIGQILPPEKGVSLDVFKQDDPPEGGDEQQPKETAKQKYIYIPNVLKEEKIHYFRIPKLGSYTAYAMVVKSFLFEEGLDKGCEEQKKYLQQKQEAEKERQSKLNELRAEIEELDKKEDEAVKASEEYIALKNQYEELLAHPVEVPPPVFLSNRKEYLVGCDTLGQDKQISQQTLLQIQELVSIFVTHWQKIQQQYLLHDINLIGTAAIPAENIESSEHWNQECEAQVNSKVPGIKERFTDEKQVNYETECVRLKALKRVLTERALKSLQTFQEYYVPKFRSALQTLLLFAGFKKEDINVPGTNILDWRRVHNCLTRELVERIMTHTHYGVKEDVPAYLKVSKLIEKFDKIDLEPILSYNAGLWLLVKIAKLSLNLRVAQRDLLLEKFEAKKKQRQAKMEETTRIEQERGKALETHKASLEPEQAEAFNEAEWLATYDAEHPVPVIPEEPEFTPYIDI